MPLLQNRLFQYKTSVEAELNEIMSWWALHMIDLNNGGFKASVNNENNTDKNAAKSIVLNSRILWSYAAAFNFIKKAEYKLLADKAYQYIIENFFDKKYGGVLWSLMPDGRILDGRKQIYGIAFTIYALAEYYKITKGEIVLQKAKDLYECIEGYSFDHSYQGYVEAFTREWKAIDDLRLSNKDDNERKTMNTHLHIIEAYANLYTVWPDEKLKISILKLLDIFETHIINHKNGHLNLFMDDGWFVKSTVVSFGHDIEAAWLLQECAEIAAENSYIEKFKNFAIRLADGAIEGWDKQQGGIWYEFDPVKNYWIYEKHWWPQAEAMVGFFNAWQMSKDEQYLQLSLASFDFIKKHLKDHSHGEWFWGICKGGSLMDKEKAGFWKCPYHNARACMEIAKRIDKIFL